MPRGGEAARGFKKGRWGVFAGWQGGRWGQVTNHGLYPADLWHFQMSSGGGKVCCMDLMCFTSRAGCLVSNHYSNVGEYSVKSTPPINDSLTAAGCSSTKLVTH